MRETELDDGFYAVIRDDPKPAICAAFVVRDHLIMDCADYLRAHPDLMEPSSGYVRRIPGVE